MRERWRKCINLQSILVNNEDKSFPAERGFMQMTISFIIIHEKPSSFGTLKLQTCQGIEINMYTSNNHRIIHSPRKLLDMMEILRLRIPRLRLGKQNRNFYNSIDPWTVEKCEPLCAVEIITFAIGLTSRGITNNDNLITSECTCAFEVYVSIKCDWVKGLWNTSIVIF